jgi:hypothetical protein
MIGLRSSALIATGRTAAERRASRVALWRQLDALRTPRAELPEEARRKRLRFGNGGADLDVSVGAQFRGGGQRRIRQVRLNGRELKPSETDGYTIWQDQCSTFVLVTLPEFPHGEYDLEIGFAD